LLKPDILTGETRESLNDVWKEFRVNLFGEANPDDFEIHDDFRYKKTDPE